MPTFIFFAHTIYILNTYLNARILQRLKDSG
jgi:hypothetical protein